MLATEILNLLHNRASTSTSSVSGVTLLIAALTAFAAFFTKQWRRPLSAPKLHSWPVIGNAAAYLADPRTAISKATKQCGRLFHINLLLVDTVWLRGNDLNKFYTDVREDTWSFGGGMGLFLNKVVIPGYFDHLKLLVRSLNAGINKTDTLQYYTDIAHQESNKSTAEWAKKDHIELFEDVSRLVHRVLVRCLMGEDFYEHNIDELFDLLHKMEADIGNILNFVLPEWVPHPPAKRLNACRDRVRDIFEKRLEERENDGQDWYNSKDYIAYTLRDKATAHLKEYFPAHHTLLMFASHTSTVASISWTIVELLQNPQRLKALQTELNNPDTNIHESPLLLACFRETGRCYSGVNMLRLANKPVTIPGSDVTVPPGSVVSISPYLTHRDPQNFSEPETYAPERWLVDNDPVDQLNTKQELAFMPFGAGSHRCPGEKLAGFIARAVAGTLVRDYDITWGPSGQPEDLDQLDFSKIGSPWLKDDASVTVKSRQ